MVSQPRQLLDRAARRETILRGAAAAFASKGYAATSMEDAAAASGITKLIVYRHFPSKEALYDAVLERVADQLRDQFRDRYTEGRPGLTSVAALVSVADEDPAAFTLLWRHAMREPQFAEHAEGIRQRAVRAAEALLASAGVDLGASHRWAAATAVSYLIGAILEWLDEGRPSSADTLAQMLATSLPPMVLAWAAADAPGAPPANV
ncbi:MAG: TetR/AcrR family transcriptional regulator [Acidimicrobiales bacterium]